MAYQSFVITKMALMPDLPFILDHPDGAINVVHAAGRYAVQVGSRNGETFVGNITPQAMDPIPAGMTPQRIAEAEVDAIGEPYVHAFVNGKPYSINQAL